MDAFLEDGSHEATIAVVRALALAVPHTTEKLQDYIPHYFTVNSSRYFIWPLGFMIDNDMCLSE